MKTLDKLWLRAKNVWENFWEEEDGMGVVEVILIIVVLIGLVLIFKGRMTSLVGNIFNKVDSSANSF